MKNTWRNRIMKMLALPGVAFACKALVTVCALVLFSSFVLSSFTISTGRYDTNASGTELIALSATPTAATLSYSEAGEEKTLTLGITNQSKANITYSYVLTLDGYGSMTSADQEKATALAAAILVYCDGEYIDTLSHLCQDGEGKIALASFVMAENTSSDAHDLTFQLHVSAPASVLSTALALKITAYTQNADYEKYLFAATESEFKAAVADVNSGLLTDPVIILSQDITLSSSVVLSSPVSLDLYGHELVIASGNTLSFTQDGTSTLFSSRPLSLSSLSSQGTIVLSGVSSALDIKEMSSSTDNTVNPGHLYAARVNVTLASAATAETLACARFDELYGEGIATGTSVPLFGSLSFYASLLTVSASGSAWSYASATNTLTTVSSTVSSTESLTIGSSAREVRLLGNDDDAVYASLLGSELLHLVRSTGLAVIVTSDLFLPKSVPGKNVSISWSSSNEDIITSDGRIADIVPQNTAVSLLAAIRVNGSIYYKEFAFRVSSQNNETKFSYLVAQLSPVLLDNVYTGMNEGVAFYYLPVVDSTSDYDYRKNYVTPSESHTGTWNAYRDIGLTSLVYTPQTTYNYVSLDTSGNDVAVYLNTAVFETFAQISIRGYFGTEEYYDGVVNIKIELGQNAKLNDLVFNYVDTELSDVDILRNILDTRLAYGMKNERGDFYLPSTYMTYSIEYVIPQASTSIITYTNEDGDGFAQDADGYHVGVNADGFYAQASTVAIGVRIQLSYAPEGVTPELRYLYFAIPAVILPTTSGFANIGVFSSVKYQVFTELPEEERSLQTIDTEVSARLSLLPSLSGTTYATGFTTSGTTITNTTGSYILARDASLATSLTLQVADTGATTNATEHKAYIMSQMLAWATGDGTGTDPYLGTTASDGQSYLNEEEVSALKTCYRALTGATETEWTTLWNSVATVAPGFVIANGTHLNSVVSSIISNYSSDIYFKYTEVLQWATNAVDWHEGTNHMPNLGVIGTYDWTMNETGAAVTSYSDLDVTSNPLNWVSGTGPHSWSSSKYQTNALYVEDDTTYISNAEAQAILAFWLNGSTASGDVTYDGVTSSVSNAAGRQFAIAFIADTTIPTTLNAGAASTILASLYTALSADPSNWTMATVNSLPVIAIADGITTGITYFTSLVSLKIIGEVTTSGTPVASFTLGQPAFIQTSSLANLVNRITTNDAATLTTLSLVNCAKGHVTMDIEPLDRLYALTRLDLSYNDGLESVGDLINLPMGSLEYLDIYGIDVDAQFLSFPLASIRSVNTSAELYYDSNGNASGGVRTNYSATGATSVLLTYLKEIGAIDGNQLVLTQDITTSSTEATDIIWHIAQGNAMTLVSASETYPEITTVAAMLALSTNYYYCSQDFTVDGVTCQAGHVYLVAYSSNSLVLTDLITTVSPDTLPTVEPTGTQSTGYVFGNDAETYTVTSTQTGTGRSGQASVNNGTILTGILANGSTTTIITNCNRVSWAGTTTMRYTYTFTKAGFYGTSYSGATTQYAMVNGSLVEYTYTYYVSQYDATYTYTVTVTETLYSGLSYRYRNANYNNTNVTLPSTYVGVTYNGTTYYNTAVVPAFSETGGTWTQGSPTGTNGWVLQSSRTYCDPVGTLSSASDYETLATLASKAALGVARYRYTGTSGSADVTSEGSTATKSFTRNAFYLLSISSNGFSWSTTTLTQPTGDTLEGILASANAVKGTSDELLYYGNYYYYTGTTTTAWSGNAYTQYHVYRLMLDASGNFYYTNDLGIYATCTTLTTESAFMTVLNGLRSNTSSDIGKLYYLSGTGTILTNADENFYEIAYNYLTKTYFLKRFTNVSGNKQTDATTDSSLTFTLGNARYYAVTSANDYGGLGGDYEVIVSATVIVDGVRYTRLFDVEIIGG